MRDVFVLMAVQFSERHNYTAVCKAIQGKEGPGLRYSRDWKGHGKPTTIYLSLNVDLGIFENVSHR